MKDEDVLIRISFSHEETDILVQEVQSRAGTFFFPKVEFEQRGGINSNLFKFSTVKISKTVALNV